MRRSKRGRDRGEFPASVYDEAIARVDSPKRRRATRQSSPVDLPLQYIYPELGAAETQRDPNRNDGEKRNEICVAPLGPESFEERHQDADFVYSQLLSQAQNVFNPFQTINECNEKKSFVNFN